MNKQILSGVYLCTLILVLCFSACNEKTKADTPATDKTVQKTPAAENTLQKEAAKKPASENQKKLQAARQALGSAKLNLKNHLVKFRKDNQNIDLAFREIEDTFQKKEAFLNQKIKDLNPEGAEIVASKLKLERQLKELNQRIEQSTKKDKKELVPEKKKLRQKIAEIVKKRNNLIPQVRKTPEVNEYFKEFHPTMGRLHNELYNLAGEAGQKGKKLLGKVREMEQRVKELSKKG